MIQANAMRVVTARVASGATNATATAMIDTWGSDGRPYHHAILMIKSAVASATDSSAKWTGLRVLEGATTAVSSAAAINGLTGTTNSTATSAQFVLPAHNDTSTPMSIHLEIPLLNRDRYFFVETTSSADTVDNCVDCILSRGGVTPDSATERGATTLVSLAS